uniref:Gentisaldehyde dehydrogenase n=1 Tax=Burkholderia sp. BC1 TaxID=1095370 RepID=A0A1L5SM60_9BURK|nr:gentisaldehyde dehydrogenase [Burkholderia sp. BC1]
MTLKPALNWINGEWIDSGIHKESINPATGEVIGLYADGGESEALAAIEAASSAFESSAWRSDRVLRARALNELADLFDQHAEALIEAVVRENGKTRYEAGFEVSMNAPKLRYYASLVRTSYGRSVLPDAGKLSVVVPEPIGVAGIIVPWNAPTVLLVRSLAPALAAGTAAVVKMPAQTAQVNALLANLISQVKSLPRGIVNLFTESGDEGARKLVESQNVPVISFTGSTHVGRAIASAAGRQLKRLNLELGGKTPMIVFDDADLDKVIPTLEKGITVFAGQFCMAGSRILVQRSIAQKVISLLKERLEAVKVGAGSDPASDMGPLINKDAVVRVNAEVEKAIAQGATVIVRGGPSSDQRLASGAFYRPTLLEVRNSRADIVQTETFGPVATLEVFDTEADAVVLANATEFGLAASIWTSDVDRPWRVGRAIAAGTIWINQWAVIYDEMEEGGQKQSGIGRLNGVAALDPFTEYKHFTISHGSQP